MNWDESPENPGEYGPYRQSERKEIYQPLIDQLLASNRAYKCYCTEEELEAEREAQRARGEMPHYAGTCANLTPEEQAEKRSTRSRICCTFPCASQYRIRIYRYGERRYFVRIR